MSMTKQKMQQIFDTVCEKLAAQKRRSINDDGGCLYNDKEKGVHCAIGHLVKIPKSYNGGVAVDDLPVKYLKEIGVTDDGTNAKDIEFLMALQEDHDGAWNLSTIKTSLRGTAKRYGLKYGAVAKLFKEWEG